jgi:hypothetical protein
MRDELTTAFIIFGLIDLTLVGTTCAAVMLLVRKVLLGKVEITILGKKTRIDRPFMTTGVIPEKEEPDRKFVSE